MMSVSTLNSLLLKDLDLCLERQHLLCDLICSFKDESIPVNWKRSRMRKLIMSGTKHKYLDLHDCQLVYTIEGWDDYISITPNDDISRRACISVK